MVLISLVLLLLAASAPTTSTPVVRVVVPGETNLTTNFIQSLREAASEEGLSIETTDRTGPFSVASTFTG